MQPLMDGDLEELVRTGSWKGKAGGYDIMGLASRHIDISDGDETFKQVVHDYAVTGLGYMYVYVDPEADYGRGEVKYTHVDPFRVYVDPASRDRFFNSISS